MHFNTLRTSLAVGLACGITGGAVAGMTGLSYEVFGSNLVDGGDNTTFRVYAELDAGNRLDAVFGNTNFHLVYQNENGASTYQNTLGGATSQSINPAFFPLAPSLEWDSYMTIGTLYNTDNALQDIGIDWSSWDPAGGDLYSSNGTWFVTPVDPQGEEVDGRVLIAQLTIFHGSSGHVATMWGGFQGKDETGTTWQWGLTPGDDGFEIWVPAPAGMALLVLPMMARRRRRRH